MVWILFFIFSWILLLLFMDRSRLGVTIYGGLIAAALGTVVDSAGHYLHFYHFFFISGKIDDFFVTILHAVGPMFAMGTLFFQFLSPDPKIQAGNITAFTLAYLAMETLVVWSGGAVYEHWHWLASLAVDILVFTAFSYVGGIIVFGNKKFRIKE